MRIRIAESRDLDRLLDLYVLLEGPYTDVHGPNGEAANLFTRVLLDPNQQTLVAEVYSEVVGSLVLAILPNLAHGGAPYAVVENFVVDEEHRGGGVGKALVRDAMRRARKAGAYKLALCSNAGRTETHGFYESLGFRKTHVGFEVKP